eukprot:Nk52_evm8s913 gene=Nk52_evmTU8s913
MKTCEGQQQQMPFLSRNGTVISTLSPFQYTYSVWERKSGYHRRVSPLMMASVNEAAPGVNNDSNKAQRLQAGSHLFESSSVVEPHLVSADFGNAQELQAVEKQQPKEFHHESPFAKLMIGGAVTWSFELVFGHYLEFLKIRKQTSNLSYMTLSRQMVSAKGLMGVLDGYFPWGSIMAIVKGAVFSCGHTAARSLLHGYFHNDVSDILAGGIGGGFQGLALSPLLLLKTRVMTDPRLSQSRSVWATTVASFQMGTQVIRNEGMRALMKGSLVLATKRVFDWTSRFFFVVVVEKFMRGSDKNRALTQKELCLCALIGGTLSATMTLPLDVAVASIQQASKAGQKTSFVNTMREQIAAGGIRGMVAFSTRGFVVRVMHVAITTMMMKTLTSYIYNHMYHPERL